MEIKKIPVYQNVIIRHPWPAKFVIVSEASSSFIPIFAMSSVILWAAAYPLHAIGTIFISLKIRMRLSTSGSCFARESSMGPKIQLSDPLQVFSWKCSLQNSVKQSSFLSGRGLMILLSNIFPPRIEHMDKGYYPGWIWNSFLSGISIYLSCLWYMVMHVRTHEGGMAFGENC